ncbi:MAG: 5'-nucleotidase C-terminal domain-containing protein [Planctomycetota bacterium]
MKVRPTQVVFSLLTAFICLVGGCRQAIEAPVTPPEAAEENSSAEIAVGAWSEVDASLEDDPEIDAMVSPYREKLQAVMGEEIGTAEASIGRSRPESPLGNLIADAILHHAKSEIDPEADLALMNNGGIRLPEIPAGAITVADIYQLVPFDNRVVVLTLTGRQIETVLQSLAEQGGEPLSGVTYQLEKVTSGDKSKWKPTNIQIAGRDLELEATYKLATLDYLAGIGGELAVLKEASERQDGEPFLRDLMIERIRELKTIRPTLDGRVSYLDESEE